MIRIERAAKGYLVKTAPSVTKGGTEARTVDEALQAVAHYYGESSYHSGKPDTCPYCREIERNVRTLGHKS